MTQSGVVMSDPQIIPFLHNGVSTGLRIGVIVRLSNYRHVPAVLPLEFLPSRGDNVTVCSGKDPDTYFITRDFDK